MKGKSIILDWRFEAHHRFSTAQIQALRDFGIHFQEYSEKAIKAWEQESEHVSDDDDPDAQELREQRERIEDLLHKGQTLGILGLYAFLERYLSLVIEYLRAAGASIPNPRRRGSYLDQLREQFLCGVGIDIANYPFQWNSLNRMRLVRNCIAHTEGWITEANVKKLGNVGLTVRENTELGPPATEFEDWWRLVDNTCQLIHDECSKRFANAD